MVSILFEKRGALRPSREITLENGDIVIKYGEQGFLKAEIKAHFSNNEEALHYLEKIVRSFRSAGFNEHDNPNQGSIGTIAYLESPQGPGRIRVDSVGDVFFEPKDHSIKKLKQDQRVLVFGIKKGAGPIASFMLGFNSPLIATEVQLLPSGKKHPKSELPDEIRSKIMSMVGDNIKGNWVAQEITKPFKIGELVYGYDSGIYRLIDIKRGIAEIKGDLAIGERIFDQKLLRDFGRLNNWSLDFSCRIPKNILELIPDELWDDIKTNNNL